MKTILKALEKNTINVFFSYKKCDEEAAMKIISILRTYSADKLEINCMANFQEGENWRTTIKQEIEKANWFILLLPDPSKDWDWCLFETGLFDRRTTASHRLICLHHPNTKIPDQINDYKHVAANEGDVENFLTMVYLDDNPLPGFSPLNPNIDDTLLKKITKDIIDLISPPTDQIRREIYEPWIKIKLDGADKITQYSDLYPAIIFDINQKARDLFEFEKKPETFGELISDIVSTQDNKHWLEELFHITRKVALGKKSFPAQGVFQSPIGKYYRPVLHAVDIRNDTEKIESFHITFTEDVTFVDNSAIPDEIHKLSILLRFTFRFRWEILEKYGISPIEEDDVEVIKNTFQRMEQDWESRGLGDAVNIIDLFHGEERQSVHEMMIAWQSVKNREYTGKLDIAIENNDTKTISKVLKEFLPINKKFLELLADRFSDVVSADVNVGVK